MPSIYLQKPLKPQEIQELQQEFPHYELLTSCDTDEAWNEIEILYGKFLTDENLNRAQRLRWIHCPTRDTEGLDLKAIQSKESILITLSQGKDTLQIAEFVLGTILAFGKCLFQWSQHLPIQEETSSSLKETMWTLQNRILLQIGLGEVGSEIVKAGKNLGMKTWGVQQTRTFHPYCDKTFSSLNLHSLLPTADVVVHAKQKVGSKQKLSFGQKEFELMKSGSILILIGSSDAIDMEALYRVAKKGKFRGILLDTPTSSPLLEIPNFISTPAVASYPSIGEHKAFQIFRHNLRLFINGKINEMKNLIFS